MDALKNEKNPQWEHINGIFKEYTTPSRVLRSFTNLSNTVIQTALSGQSKFLFEILQNADDAFEDPNKQVEVHFILEKNYFIVHHNGKGFDYNDVERICDYASQIEEVKATDLSKTGYKGLGFKSLFNLSECIYICSNGYSFRFDKSYWPDSESKPWQVIPIWSDSLPHSEKFSYNQSVNLILKIKKEDQLSSQLKELVDHPEMFLFLHRINKLKIHLNGKEYYLERKSEKYGKFNKIIFCNNGCVINTWLSGTYEREVPSTVRNSIQGGSKFVYPDKIKKATKSPFTFSVQVDNNLQNVSKIKGVLYSTLPTQLHLMLPYHINSLFVLNLDRTQLHENEWNVFLVQQIGYLQLLLLKDLAQLPSLKNYVIDLFVREVSHPYSTFSNAFMKGFKIAKKEISWLPAHKGSHLLKIEEAWIDETEFFKRDFKNIQDSNVEPYLIDYDVKNKNCLLPSEVKRFTFDQLFQNFPTKYYRQLTTESYKTFISYMFEKWKKGSISYSTVYKLKHIPFLKGKNGELLPPENALLEDSGPVPDFFLLKTVDNKFFQDENINSLKNWLVQYLGAKRLSGPIQIIRESILKWIDSRTLQKKITQINHLQIMEYLAENVEQLNMTEIKKFRDNLLILTKGNRFKLAKDCYLCDAVVIRELDNVISDEDKISPSYNTDSLRKFFIIIGVKEVLPPVDVLRKSILTWIKDGSIKNQLTEHNYHPIIGYFASCYTEIKNHLIKDEVRSLRKIPVLTCSNRFQKAGDCYLDTVIPKVKSLESIIENDKLVPTNTLSECVKEFLVEIGVSPEIDSLTVLRLSILKWIEDGVINEKITTDNHLDILGYINKHIRNLWCYDLEDNEKKSLKRFPILTRSNTFREACCCYWPESNTDINDGYKKIPGIESLISADELVSQVYEQREKEEQLHNIAELLKSYFSVKSIKFTDIYEKYSDQLNNSENLKWFFSELISYWKKNKWSKDRDKLLKFVRNQFTSSCLLAKDGKLYCSTKLYSSHFHEMQKFGPDIIHLLDYDGDVPKDLENWLGFKDKLEISCMLQLLEAIEGHTGLGVEETLTFFKTLLEQLRLKSKNDIRKHKFKLLSQENELEFANDLYYFKEEEAVCILDYCYLKRIHGMSHDETLELASLCGVNVVPFKQDISFGGSLVYDKEFKEFYLKRLPFIALQESKKLNESPVNMLESIYIKLSSIELYNCDSISLQYPFGDPTNIRIHFEDTKIYVVGKWKKLRSKIHEFVKEKLCLETDITEILDMETIEEEDIEEWLHYQNEDPKKFISVVEELQKLLSEQEESGLLASFENMNLNVTPQRSSKKSKGMGNEIHPYNAGHRTDRTVIENEKSDNRTIKTNKQKPKKLNLEKLYSLERQLRELLPKEFQQGCTIFRQERNFGTKEQNINENSASENYGDGDQSVCEEKFNLITVVLQQLLQNPESLSQLIFKKEEEGLININEESFSESYSNAVLPPIEHSTSRRHHSRRSPSNNQYYTVSLQVSHSFSNNNRLNEKYVYFLLQEHYKNKYPDWQISVAVGSFTLTRQFSTIEIIWLNEAEEVGLPYDLMVKKDGEIKQVIEVISSDQAKDSFNLSNSKFIANSNRMAVELFQYKNKYCIYRVFNKYAEPVSQADNMMNISAVYKIMPIKI